MTSDGLRTSEGTDKSLGGIVTEVSEKASLLIREEIELAKAEVTSKIAKLLRGSVVAAAAGVFGLLALLMLMHALAWGINDLLFDNSTVWAGFLIEAGIFIAIGIGAGWYAFRSFQRGAPPVPEMAIAEARETVEAIGGGGQ